jgi:hypothetical protein
MNRKTLLIKIIMIMLMLGVVTAFLTQLLYYFFGNFWLSLSSSVAIQIIITYFARQISYERKVQKSLDSYDKLEFRKYPAQGIQCASCKKPNDFLLDWTTVGFQCVHCKIENGLEINLLPFVKAVIAETETI